MKLKKFMVGMMLAATTVSMLGEALARPMGGGRSFGRQSQNVGRQAPAPAPTPAPAAAPRQAQPAPAPAPAPAAKAPSRWKGLLGGALLGLGLGALLSHFGLGGALASMISTLLMVALLAGVAFFIYRMVRGKRDSNAKRQCAVRRLWRQPACTGRQRARHRFAHSTAAAAAARLVRRRPGQAGAGCRAMGRACRLRQGSLPAPREKQFHSPASGLGQGGRQRYP